MRNHLKIAILAGVLALVALPATALATRPAEPGNGKGNTPTEPGNGHKPTEGTSGQGNGPNYAPESPPTTKAFGYYCQGESKKHVPGTPGTPFSACVKAHETAAAHPNMSPGRACRALPGKHVVKGEKGTPRSRCVAKVIEQRKKEREAAA